MVVGWSESSAMTNAYMVLHFSPQVSNGTYSPAIRFETSGEDRIGELRVVDGLYAWQQRLRYIDVTNKQKHAHFPLLLTFFNRASAA